MIWEDVIKILLSSALGSLAPTCSSRKPPRRGGRETHRDVRSRTTTTKSPSGRSCADSPQSRWRRCPDTKHSRCSEPYRTRKPPSRVLPSCAEKLSSQERENQKPRRFLGEWLYDVLELNKTRGIFMMNEPIERFLYHDRKFYRKLRSEKDRYVLKGSYAHGTAEPLRAPCGQAGAQMKPVHDAELGAESRAGSHRKRARQMHRAHHGHFRDGSDERSAITGHRTARPAEGPRTQGRAKEREIESAEGRTEFRRAADLWDFFSQCGLKFCK